LKIPAETDLQYRQTCKTVDLAWVGVLLFKLLKIVDINIETWIQWQWPTLRL
jgi:hypothetical protein